MGLFRKKKKELDEYEMLCKALGRRPHIDDSTIVHDLLSLRDFEDSTIERIEHAPNSEMRDRWREDPAEQKEAKKAQKEAEREAKRQDKLEAKDRRNAAAEERRMIREEREARRQEYLQERRDAGIDDDDDTDFID